MVRARTNLIFILSAVAFLAMVLPCARAQWARPPAATRLVEEWSFEEREFYLEDLPPHWFRTNPGLRDQPKAGFPHYNRALLSNDIAADGGRWSMKLPTRGGSTGIALARGVLPAMPSSDYLITAQVRTEGLVHARARIIARFSLSVPPDLSHPGHAGYENIQGAEVVSEDVLSEGQWRTIEMHLPSHPEAEFVQLELQLLQPDELRIGEAVIHEVGVEDYSGAVYFDNITVFQAPRVRITTSSPGNIVVAPESPSLAIDVRDLTGETLEIEVALWDMDGAMIDRALFDANTAGEPIMWRPAIETFGWYRTVVRAHGPRGDVGVAVADLLYVASLPETDIIDDNNFGIIAEHMKADELDQLPMLVRRLGVGPVQVAAWADIQDDESSLRHIAFERAMESLLERGHHVSFVLGRVPLALAQAARIDAERPAEFIARGGTDWIGSLAATLTRFGERVTRWQLGPTTGDTSLWEADVLPAALDMHAALSELVPRPVITLPWSAIVAPPRDPAAQLPSAVTLTFPPEIPSQSVPDYVRLWLDRGVEVIAVLELPNDDLYGRRAVLLDLARRACLAWHAGATTVSIEAPWSCSVLQDGTLLFAPRAEGLVMRTLSSALGALTPAGQLPAPDDVTLLIAQGPDHGAIIAWSDTEEPYTLSAFLGEGTITVRDSLGGTHIVSPSDGMHTIALTETPQIIEGIDVDIVRFRAALLLTPSFIEAQSRRHTVALHLHNPFERSLTGRVRFAEPQAWSFQPRVLAFSIPAGGDTVLTTSIALGVGEEAGVRDVIAEVDLAGDGTYPTMAVPLKIELGMRGVDLSASYRFTRPRNGRSRRLVVTVAVTNLDTRPLSIESFIQAPGFRGQSAPISALPPGESTAKVFVFEDGNRLIGSSVRIGLRENAGSARLNKTIRIE